MPIDGETAEALRRAGRRAVYHLLKAGVEGLKAVEAVVDELASIRREEPESDQGRAVRIEIE